MDCPTSMEVTETSDGDSVLLSKSCKAHYLFNSLTTVLHFSCSPSFSCFPNLLDGSSRLAATKKHLKLSPFSEVMEMGTHQVSKKSTTRSLPGLNSRNDMPNVTDFSPCCSVFTAETFISPVVCRLPCGSPS